MEELAPGYILQKMFLKNRLKKILRRDMEFYDVGSGSGNTSKILLDLGLKGTGFDLNEEACQLNESLNKPYILSGKYNVVAGNFFECDHTRPVDVIISSMVIEHLPDHEINRYFNHCKSMLKPSGIIVSLVPASMKHWGIEDEIAGHFKRYSFDCFRKIAEVMDLRVKHLVGLTYPLSNLLFSVSNRIVERQEGYKKNLSLKERTVLSGHRNVKFKTVFPSYFRLFLNPITLYPFYLLQLVFRRTENSMVIYCELQVV